MTRSKTLINNLYRLGLSVSYQRIIDLEEKLATAVSERFEEDECVVPASLRKGLFTIGALDNLDPNPSSTTASSTFHGTAISVFQLPQENNPGYARPPLVFPPKGKSHKLPDEYATVNPVELNTNNITVPIRPTHDLKETCIKEESKKEEKWVEHVRPKLENSHILQSDDRITWAAYHSTANNEDQQPALSALLPLFYEKVCKLIELFVVVFLKRKEKI